MTVNTVEVEEDPTITMVMQVMISKALPTTVGREIDEMREDKADMVTEEMIDRTTAETMATLVDAVTIMEVETKAAMVAVTIDEMTVETTTTEDVKSKDKIMATVKKDADPSKVDDMKVEVTPMVVVDKSIKEVEIKATAALVTNSLHDLSRAGLATEVAAKVKARATEAHMEVAAVAVATTRNLVKPHSRLRATVQRSRTCSLPRCLS